jgi:hypothetical protein
VTNNSNYKLLQNAHKKFCVNTLPKKVTNIRSKDQGTPVEATVVRKLNQGTIRQKGCHLLSGSFLGYFFGQAKK